MTDTFSVSALSDLDGLVDQLPKADAQAAQAALDRQNSLTKPPGALGHLETLAIFMASWQGIEKPQINTAQALVFAGNHGICAQGVNPFPQEVTAQMVLNFQHGGAARKARPGPAVVSHPLVSCPRYPWAALIFSISSGTALAKSATSP